jgi:hypothetical protein
MQHLLNDIGRQTESSDKQQEQPVLQRLLFFEQQEQPAFLSQTLGHLERRNLSSSIGSSDKKLPAWWHTSHPQVF